MLKHVASLGGLGRLPGAPGTWGSLGAGLVYGLLYLWCPTWVVGLVVLVGVLISFPLCDYAAREEPGPDPSWIVWDELAGLGLAIYPPVWWTVFPDQPWLGFGIAVGLFRGFDILKPLPIRWIERNLGGYGITLDDLIAGIYCQGIWMAVWFYPT